MAKDENELFDSVIDNADAATDALGRLGRAIGALDQVAASFNNLTNLSKGIEGVSNALTTFKTLPETINSINSVNFGNFADQINILATGLEPLRGFTTQATGLINSLSKLDQTVASVNDIEYDNFRHQIRLLASSLEQLNVVETKVGATIAALEKIKTVAEDLNNLNSVANGSSGFDRFKTNIDSLAMSFTSLSNIKSSLGAVLKELRRFVETANTLNQTDIGRFAIAMSDIRNALQSLESLSLGDFGGIARSLRTLTLSVYDIATLPDLESFKTNITVIANALLMLSSIQKGDFSTVAHSLKKLVDSIISFNQVSDEDVQRFASAVGFLVRNITQSLTELQGVELKGFATLIKNLGKIPQLIEKVNSIDQSKLDEFILRINKLVVALAPVEKSLAASLVLFKGYPRVVNQAAASSHRASSSFKLLGGRLLSLRTLLGGAGVVYLFRRLSSVLSKAFKISNDYIETLNLFAISLEKNAESAFETIESWRTLLGLDPAMAMEKWGEFNLLLQGFGPTTDQWISASAQMSQNLTQLAYDMASLYNVDPSIAFTKLQSGISGMTRPLRAWGIDIGEVALQEYAMARGINKSVKAMTQAEKAQLRYLLIMEKTSKESMNIQGDLARTLTTPGNSLRILKELFVQLGRAVGDFFTPILAAAIPYVTAFTRGLTSMFNTLAATMRALTGYKPKSLQDFIDGSDGLSQAEKDLIQLNTGITDTLNSQTSQYAEASEAVEEYSSALYGLVSGIDKFNVLSQSDSESALGSFFLTDEDLEAYNFLDGIQDQITEAERTLAPFFESLTGSLNGVLKFMGMLNLSFKDLITFIQVLVALKIASFFISFTTAMKVATVSLGAYNAATGLGVALTNLLSTVAVAGLVFIIMKLAGQISSLIVEWDSLTLAQKAVRIASIALTTAIGLLWINFVLVKTEIYKVTAAFISSLVPVLITMVKLILTKVLLALTLLDVQMKMLGTTTLWALGGFVALSAGILTFIALADKMGKWQKVIVILAAVAVAAATAAIAMNAFVGLGAGAIITAAAIAGGTTLAVGSIIAANSKNKFAEGGFPQGGSLFVAGEKGPEWLGRTGKQSTVVNDTQMTDLMYKAVRDGVVDAMLATEGDGGKDITINFKGIESNDLARALATPLMNELRRQGYKVAKV